MWCQDKKESDHTLVNADRFNKHRRTSIKDKIEKFLYINKTQVTIREYYFTTKGGLVAWVKLDKDMVSEIHRRSIKASSKNLCMATFIPKIARDRKVCIDRLLMEFKKDNKDFCYIIRNGNKDILVLVKITSEFNTVPTDPFPSKTLGPFHQSRQLSEVKQKKMKVKIELMKTDFKNLPGRTSERISCLKRKYLKEFKVS